MDSPSDVSCRRTSSKCVFKSFCFVIDCNRSCAEEALRMLNGTPLGGQNIRLSWGRSPSNKQVLSHPLGLMN